MSAPVETREDQLVASPESGLAEPTIAIDFNAILTQAVAEKFEASVHKLARDHGYFYDKPDGNPYSPTRIYEMTQKIAAVALTVEGNVATFVPQLEVRHKRNADKIFGPQTTAREFGIKAARLNAIKALIEEGALSSQDAAKLTESESLEAAFQTHEEEWQSFLRSTREVENRQLVEVAGDRAVVGNVEVITTEPEAQLQPAKRPASGASRHTARFRRRVITAVVGTMTILGMLLAACSPRGGTGDIPTQPPPSSTPAGEVFNPGEGGATTTAVAPATAEAPTPAPFSGTEAAPTSTPLYGPPNLDAAVRLAGSGGSGRNEIITRAGVPEETLKLYENAAYAWAANNGFAKDAVNIEYLFDGSSWNMVLREKASGNYIWSEDGEGALMTYPTIIRVDATGPHADPDMGARVLEGTKDARAMLVNGFVVVVRGSVQIGEKTYYTEWFNTLTGTWEKIPEVQAAIPKPPDVHYGEPSGANDFPVIDGASIPTLIAYVRSQPSLLPENSSEAVWTGRIPEEIYQEGINLQCKLDDNCAVVASFQTQEAGENYYHLLWEIRNSDGTSGFLVTRFAKASDGSRLFENTMKAFTTFRDMRRRIGIITGYRNPAAAGQWYDNLVNQPELQPLVDQWVETGIMPKELERLIVFVFIR